MARVSKNQPQSVADVKAMLYPVRCLGCNKIHDAADGVTVVGRYSDCTRWKCPNCERTLDDRPLGWGGNIEKIDKRTYGEPYLRHGMLYATDEFYG